METEAIAAIERYIIDHTERIPGGFGKPEELADLVDLSIAHSPVLLPRRHYPNQVVRLANDKFAIYDVGFPLANMGKHCWNVPASELRVHRARFLLQRDLFHQDLIIDSDNSLTWYRWWTGGPLIDPKWVIRQRLVPYFIPAGTFIPDKATNPLGQHATANYVYADGSIEVRALEH